MVGESPAGSRFRLAPRASLRVTSERCSVITFSAIRCLQSCEKGAHRDGWEAGVIFNQPSTASSLLHASGPNHSVVGPVSFFSRALGGVDGEGCGLWALTRDRDVGSILTLAWG